MFTQYARFAEFKKLLSVGIVVGVDLARGGVSKPVDLAHGWSRDNGYMGKSALSSLRSPRHTRVELAPLASSRQRGKRAQRAFPHLPVVSTPNCESSPYSQVRAEYIPATMPMDSRFLFDSASEASVMG